LMLRPLNAWVKKLCQDELVPNAIYARQVSEAVTLAREIEVFDVGVAMKQRLANQADETRKRAFASNFGLRIISPIYQAIVLLLLLAAMATVVAAGVERVELLGITVLLLLRVSAYTQSLQGLFQSVTSKIVYLTGLDDFASKHEAARL